jgi:hypothetical protein
LENILEEKIINLLRSAGLWMSLIVIVKLHCPIGQMIIFLAEPPPISGDSPPFILHRHAPPQALTAGCLGDHP